MAYSDYACDACHDSSCLSNSECAPGPNCNDYQSIPLTDDQKRQILSKHNELRNKVASGDQSGQPSASNMIELVWDDELANIAQCYANKCVYGHFSCELPNGRGGFGQNIFANGSSNRPNNFDYPGAVQSWYDEVSVFPAEVIDSFSLPESGAYGHYSQIVWAETKRVGCGIVLFNKGGWRTHVFCNYGPPGNYVDFPVYRRGAPATDCSNGRSDTYSGLCKN